MPMFHAILISQFKLHMTIESCVSDSRLSTSNRWSFHNNSGVGEPSCQVGRSDQGVRWRYGSANNAPPIGHSSIKFRRDPSHEPTLRRPCSERANCLRRGARENRVALLLAEIEDRGFRCLDTRNDNASEEGLYLCNK